MDLSKLEQMTTDALRAIRDKCDAVLTTRVDNQLRSGSIASFRDRDGSTRYLRVNRVNDKSVSGVECDPKTFGAISTTRWRVGRSLLTVIANPGVRAAPISKPVTPYKPTSVPDSAW